MERLHLFTRLGLRKSSSSCNFWAVAQGGGVWFLKNSHHNSISTHSDLYVQVPVAIPSIPSQL